MSEMVDDPAAHLGSTSPAFLEDLRRQMLRFAMARLRDPSTAEDVVQEAFVGALRNADSFRGASALRTWVFAILKNKIADALRRQQRLVYAGSLLASAEEEEGSEPPVFDLRGAWQAERRPGDWSDPESSMQQEEFWKVLVECLDGLPPQQAEVLMMREVIGLDSDAICSRAGVTTNNLHVILHRARLRLRACLETHWFAGDTP